MCWTEFCDVLCRKCLLKCGVEREELTASISATCVCDEDADVLLSYLMRMRIVLQHVENGNPSYLTRGPEWERNVTFHRL